MKTVQPKFRYIQLLLAFLLSIFLLNLKSFPTQTKLLASLPSEPLLNPLKVSSPQHQQLIPTFSPTSTLYISPSQTPAPASLAPSSQPILPSEHIIPIQGHRQRFSIDCEASAAVDWAAYYGVTIDEFEFQSKIPKSDNPDYGFVGSVNGDWGQVPPAAYGVYAQPIANLLVSYGLPAYAVRNASLELIKNQISHNNPVLVWVVGRM